MRHVPSRHHPVDMPGPVRAAIQTLGSEARTEVLRAVCTAGPLLTHEVAELAAVSDSAALRHLKALEALGLVESVTVAGIGRAGMKLSWRAHPARLAEIADAWLRYARGN